MLLARFNIEEGKRLIGELQECIAQSTAAIEKTTRMIEKSDALIARIEESWRARQVTTQSR